MKTETTWFQCGVCGSGTGPVENDIPSDETDSELPPGWIATVARRAIPNPGYQSLDDFVTGLLETAGVPEAERGQAHGVLRLQNAGTFTPEPTHLIEEVELHLCPEHTAGLLALDPEAFAAYGWGDELETPPMVASPLSSAALAGLASEPAPEVTEPSETPAPSEPATEPPA